jgi:hypothetical protein
MSHQNAMLKVQTWTGHFCFLSLLLHIRLRVPPDQPGHSCYQVVKPRAYLTKLKRFLYKPGQNLAVKGSNHSHILLICSASRTNLDSSVALSVRKNIRMVESFVSHWLHAAADKETLKTEQRNLLKKGGDDPWIFLYIFFLGDL